ncbi:MAG: CbtB-domain containing protein [Solirubrobacterales bacterium]|nr:CbtB-domain containing protein [Solirubrobacterales bacterium]
MSDLIIEGRAAASPLPVASTRELLPYALFAGLMLMLLVYVVGAEQGATSVVGGHVVHEFVHDARHLLGFPCH